MEIMKKVVFHNNEASKKGFSILLRAGTIVYTDLVESYIVPEDSIKKLKEAGITEFDIKEPVIEI